MVLYEFPIGINLVIPLTIGIIFLNTLTICPPAAFWLIYVLHGCGGATSDRPFSGMFSGLSGRVQRKADADCHR